MAEKKYPTPTTELTEGDTDLRIEIWRDTFAQYTGTTARLQAEGLIPKDFEWPRAAVDKRWQAGGFDYWLRRTRPKGHKGPMRSWLEVDNWSIRVEVTGRGHHWLTYQCLKRQAEELVAACHRQTAAGSAERSAAWRRYWATVEDMKFQAFRSIVIPERKKPGRKPKNATAVQGADHA